MTKLRQLEAASLKLSDSDRATLASHILATLPPVLADHDNGLAEARRRDRDLEQNPDSALTWTQLKRKLGR